MVPVVVGVGAALLALLVGSQKKQPGGKSYDDGIKDGRKAVEDEHKAKEEELKRLTAIARKQVRLENANRRNRFSSRRDDDGDELGDAS